MIIVLDYLKVKYSVISRERGMSLEQLKYFRRLILEGSYEDAIKFLSVADKNLAGRADLIKKVRLLIQFEARIKANKISWKDLDEEARKRNYKLTRNYMSGDYFTIPVKEIEEMLKALK